MNAIKSAPKLIDFYSILSNHEKLLQFLRNNRLIEGERDCKNCKSDMVLSTNASKADHQEWRCRNCMTVESIRNNSIFQVSFYKLNNLLLLLINQGCGNILLAMDLGQVGYCNVLV